MPPFPPPPIHLWGVTAKLHPLPGGHRNTAFRTVGLRRDLVFKSTRRAPEALGWLGQVQALARQTGLHVPTPVPSRAGNLLEAGWTCETFLSGSPLRPEDMPLLLPQISAFHDLAAALPQRPGFLSSAGLLDQARGGDVDLDAMPADLARTCRAAWHAVSAGRQTVIHGDLNPSNLLRCADGRIALLDWDECRRDLALFDLGQLRPPDADERRALLAWEIACSWRIEPAHARTLADRL